MKSPLARLELDRRGFIKGLGALGAAAWTLSPARAFALPEDKIKVVHYFSTPGDAQGRQGQPMVNQSSNVVMIETLDGKLYHSRLALSNLPITPRICDR